MSKEPKDFKWFAVETATGYDKKVCDNIITVANNREMRDQILAACLPYEVKQKKKSKKKRTSAKTAQNVFLFKEDEYTKDEYVLEPDEPEKTENEEEYEIEEVKNLLYTNYVFVKLARFDIPNEGVKISNEAWHLIRGIRGFRRFLGPDGKPIPLTDDEVKQFHIEDYVDENGENSENPAAPVKFTIELEEGEEVIVVGGAFDGTIGEVESVDADNRTVKIRYFHMGRMAAMEFPADQVKKL